MTNLVVTRDTVSPHTNNTPNLPTNIVGFREFDSSVILNQRGGIPRPIGDFPESLSRAMLVGTMLVGRLGVHKLRISESKLLGNLLGTQEFHPLNPESD